MEQDPNKLRSYSASRRTNKLVVIIPALNEERTIGDVIVSIPKAIAGIEKIEVIVIDDGSTDNTSSVAQQRGAQVVRHPENIGVGGAFHTGIEAALAAGADVIVNMDADGQFNPADIPALIEPVLRGRAEFVSATRFAREEFMPTMPPVKRWGNVQVMRMVNLITGKKFTDVSCGFRAYTRETALKLVLFGKFTYTHETLIDLALKGISMAEVPLKIRGEREFGKSRVAASIWRFAIKSASIMFRSARDYKPFYFFGIPGLIILALGVLAGLFLLIHFLNTGQTAPYRSLVTVSGVFIIVGALLLFQSMLADMLFRNRVLLEQNLYLARKQAYKQQAIGRDV